MSSEIGGRPLPSLMRIGCSVARLRNEPVAASNDQARLAECERPARRSARRSGLGGRSGSRERLEFFAWLEAHGFAGRNANLLSGARVAADAGFARLHVEHAEAAKLDAFSA